MGYVLCCFFGLKPCGQLDCFGFDSSVWLYRDQPQRFDPERLSFNHKSQSVSPTSVSSDLLEADILMVPCMAKDATKSRPVRRIPPALRVRFTPEHLRDVLMHVGEAPHAASRGSHPRARLTGI